MKLKEQVASAIRENVLIHEQAQAVINEFVDYLETEAERLEEKYFASAATYRAIAKQLSGEMEKE